MQHVLCMTRHKLALIIGLLLTSVLACADDADFRTIDVLKLSRDLSKILREPAMTTAAYWRSKPSLSATFAYPREPTLSQAERKNIDRLKRGQFSPHKLYEWQALGVPPSWSVNPVDSRTYDFYRHALVWLQPLVEASVAEHDLEARTLLQRVIEDWVRNNSRPPGALATLGMTMRYPTGCD